MADTMTWALRRGNPATVEIYDSPEPGRTGKELQVALAALHPQRLLITINSACGTFAQGLDLYDVLSHGSGEVKTFTTFAANGGALVAMAAPTANRYISSDGAWIAQAPGVDHVEALGPMVERLQTLTYEVALLLSGAVGSGDTEWWRSAMESGTLYTSDLAVKGGIVGGVAILADLQKPWAPSEPQAHWKRRQPQVTGNLIIAGDPKNAGRVVTW